MRTSHFFHSKGNIRKDGFITEYMEYLGFSAVFPNIIHHSHVSRLTIIRFKIVTGISSVGHLSQSHSSLKILHLRNNNIYPN